MGIKDSALKISGSVLKKMVEKEQQKKRRKKICLINIVKK